MTTLADVATQVADDWYRRVTDDPALRTALAGTDLAALRTRMEPAAMAALRGDQAKPHLGLGQAEPTVLWHLIAARHRSLDFAWFAQRRADYLDRKYAPPVAAAVVTA